MRSKPLTRAFDWGAYLLIVAIAVAAIVIVVRLGTAHGTTPVRNSTVSIQANNPYNLKVLLEVKCDWDGKSRTYRLHKFYQIPGKKSVTIYTPSDVRFCEVWPKIKWL